MKSKSPLFSDQIVACVATARAPTLYELTELAARIWIEGACDRSRMLWDQLSPTALGRDAALRAARAALNGAG